MIELFSNDTDAEKFLIEKRTSNAISSIITESYFEKLFLYKQESLKGVTTGWYYSYSAYRKEIYIFILKKELNDLDYEIVSKLKGNVWKVYLESSELFLQRVESSKENRVIKVDEFLMNNKLKEIFRKVTKTNIEEINKRSKYCQYLQNEKQLIDSANIAKIENYFLNKYFYTTNLDFFIKNELGCLLFEVKFKYPASNNTYGINNLQFKALKYFKDSGIRVYNIILNNPKRLDVIDYMEAGENGEQWLYAKFDEDEEQVAKFAPAYTSYFETSVQSYYEFPVTKYRQLRRKHNFIDMSCPKCGAKMTVRRGRYNEFLGCEKFFDCNCKGNISLE